MGVFPNFIVSPPGPKARDWLKKDECFVSASYPKLYPLVVQSAKDCVVKDVDENEYIDLNAGAACLNVGSNHPKVIDAVKNQCEKFLHYSNANFYYEHTTRLAEQLSKITPGEYEKKTYFGNSGTEAVEAAIKLARWHTRKQLFIGFINSFHGNTMGSLSFTSNSVTQKRHFFPPMPGVIHVPFGYCYRCPLKMSHSDCDYDCIDFIDECILQKYAPPEDVAAFVFESIQGEGGYIVPPPEFFQRLKKLADDAGVLMIADEVQSGMGRTGKWFAIEHWDIEPDIICSGNTLASGLPLGATIANTKIMDWSFGSHTSTTGGNPLSCAAALAVIDVITEERLLDNANKQGTYVLKRLKEFSEENSIVGDVRGKGLMIGIELVEDKESKKAAIEKAHDVTVRCWKRGVAIGMCGTSTLRLSPPLTIQREMLGAALDIVEDTINEVAKEA